MKKSLLMALILLSAAAAVQAAPAKKKSTPAPAKPASVVAQPNDSAHAPAPSASAPAKQVKDDKEGELSATIQGTRKDKMIVGKLDPPAAFNLEDIQNFPEDRLHPVLNNPITFEEGRDFSNMMDSQDENLVHPSLPEISKTPYLTMKTVIDKPAKDWAFSVIDQGGTPVSTQEGKGSPPSVFSWSGDDKVRGHVAVDT